MTSLRIPRILHQTWKTAALPPAFQRWQATWLRLHPDWEYRFYTDDDCRNFMAEHYAAYLPMYDGYDAQIKRVDMVRYFLLHHYGGVYADMDFEALKPMDDFLAGADGVIGVEPLSHWEKVRVRGLPFDALLCNAWMASVPGHRLWAHLFELAPGMPRKVNAVGATGPYLLTRAYETLADQAGIRIAPASTLYPVDLHEERTGVLNDPDLRGQYLKDAVAVHHWVGTWTGEWMLPQVKAHFQRMLDSKRQGQSPSPASKN
jgi:mannosyltransferase OCH1-like enzyme